MSLQEVSKNKKIAEQLAKLLDSGRLVHAFLFAGGSSADRKELGCEFAKELLDSGKSLENDEDFLLLKKPEDKTAILVEQVEELIARLKYKPFRDRHVVLVEDSQLMSSAAQNKFLKALEEPSSDAVIILLSERADAMLPTVVSRCNTYYLEESEPAVSEETSSAAKELVRCTLKRSAYYIKKQCIKFILDAKDNSREIALDFLDAYESELRASLNDPQSRSDDTDLVVNAMNACIEARKNIKLVHSVAYTIKQMCLRI